MSTTCAKKGCAARSFADTDRCIHHQPIPGMGLFKAWFAFVAFVAFVALMAIGGVGWAAFELVTWVTR